MRVRTMAKTIKGFELGKEPNVLQAREAMPYFTNIFGKYFPNVGNKIVQVEQEPMPGTAYIYSKVKTMESCGHECGFCNACIDFGNKWGFGVADVVWEHMHLNQLKPNFFRPYTTPDQYEKRLCPKSTLLIMDKYVIGEYCKGKNILLASDWTQETSYETFVKDVLTKLEDEKLLIIPDKRTKPPMPKITLGADIELETIMGGSIVKARNLPDLFSNGSYPRIGRDGSQDQREIRPDPTESPEELVENIKTLLGYTKEQWSLVGKEFSLGGHIHIGGIKKSQGYLQLMDYFIGEPLKSLNGSARLGSSFGKNSDCRDDNPYYKGIEYRTPPAGWIANPRLALIVTKITKLLAEIHYSGKDISLDENLVTDLIKIGLPEDMAKEYPALIEKYKGNLPEDVRRSWGIKIKINPNVEFRDNWDPGVKLFFKQELEKHLSTMEIEKTIVLYGCSAERGNVIACPNDLRVALPTGYKYVSPIREGIGIPYSIRNGRNDPSSIVTIVKTIAERM